MVKKLIGFALLTTLFIGIIFLISFAISYYYEFTFSDILFSAGLTVLVIGIYFSIQGRSFLGNSILPQEHGYQILDALEAEREMQEIRNQGTMKYVLENRMMDFRTKPFSMIISGVITVVLSYFIT